MLKDYILASGQTQKQWAERLSVSGSHLSSILSGVRLPSLELAARIERETGGRVTMQSWLDAKPDAAA